jgi:hypothetical protein
MSQPYRAPILSFPPARLALLACIPARLSVSNTAKKPSNRRRHLLFGMGAKAMTRLGKFTPYA